MRIGLNCWKCGSEVEAVGFQSVCDKCHSWLHCCKNCKHYRPGSPNDCSIPGTDPISDREARNFCDEFSPLGKQLKQTADPKEAARRLFKDED